MRLGATGNRRPRSALASGSAGPRPVRFTHQPGGHHREPRSARTLRFARAAPARSVSHARRPHAPFRTRGAWGSVGPPDPSVSHARRLGFRRSARPIRFARVAPGVPEGHPGLGWAVASESPPTLHHAARSPLGAPGHARCDSHTSPAVTAGNPGLRRCITHPAHFGAPGHARCDSHTSPAVTTGNPGLRRCIFEPLPPKCEPRDTPRGSVARRRAVRNVRPDQRNCDTSASTLASGTSPT